MDAYSFVYNKGGRNASRNKFREVPVKHPRKLLSFSPNSNLSYISQKQKLFSRRKASASLLEL